MKTSKSIFASKIVNDHNEYNKKETQFSQTSANQSLKNVNFVTMNSMTKEIDNSKWDMPRYRMEPPVEIFECPMCDEKVKIKDSHLHLEKHRNRVKPNANN